MIVAASAMPPPALFEVRGLAVRAGAGPILIGALDFDLALGDRVAVVGRSGCGKTTLLRTLAGLVDAAAGTIRLRGRPAESWGWPAFRRRVLYVGQQPALGPTTVAACLARPFSFRGLTEPFPAERARALLAAAGLDAAVIWTQPTPQLSIGQKQRVALVRALLLEPECLLLDEPTSGLDMENTQAVEDLIRRASDERGTAALVVTHDLAHARRLGARVIDLAVAGGERDDV